MIPSKDEFINKLTALLSDAGLERYAPSGERLFTIASRLDEFGKKFNLTAITDPDEVMKKHLIDSLFSADAMEKLGVSSVIDIGSGAGFPSLPAAAALPGVSVTALDSTAKKVNYMTETAACAGIGNFSAVTARAEEYVSSRRESFDCATARAVAALPVLCELCLPYVRVGGYFIAMKGAAAKEEADAAKSAAAKLGAAPAEIREYSLPSMEDKRFLIIYRKISPTPKEFPRNFSQISKKPL